MWNEIKDFAVPELDVYARTSEVQLLRYYEPEPGIFIAESPKVIERALKAGYQPISFLVEHKDLEGEAQEILKQYPDVDVIMCGNDQTALGAKVAAETDQAYAGVVIYGVDGSPDLKKELQKSDDIIVGTAAQRPITLGKDAVKSAFQVLDGEKIKEPIYEETFLITKDNVDMYGADGWQ